MKDVTGVAKVCERINKDIEETNNRINRRTQESKRLKDRMDEMCKRLAFLKEANIKKEGRINYFEGIVESMSDKLCHCGESQSSFELNTQRPEATEGIEVEQEGEEEEDEELEYANDSEYHTPNVVRDLRLIESPTLSLGGMAHLEEGDCGCPRPGISWRSGGVSPTSSSEEPPLENDVAIPIQVKHSSLVNPVHGQRAIRSSGPIRSKPSIFYPRHPYKTSGDHQGWNVPIADLRKRYFWRQWARTPGNPYGRFVESSDDSESIGESPSQQQGESEDLGIVSGSGSGDRVD